MALLKTINGLNQALPIRAAAIAALALLPFRVLAIEPEAKLYVVANDKKSVIAQSDTPALVNRYKNTIEACGVSFVGYLHKQNQAIMLDFKLNYLGAGNKKPNIDPKLPKFTVSLAPEMLNLDIDPPKPITIYDLRLKGEKIPPLSEEDFPLEKTNHLEALFYGFTADFYPASKNRTMLFLDSVTLDFKGSEENRKLFASCAGVLSLRWQMDVINAWGKIGADCIQNPNLPACSNLMNRDLEAEKVLID